MYDHLSSLEALLAALSDLDALCLAIQDKYVASLREGRHEWWDERS